MGPRSRCGPRLSYFRYAWLPRLVSIVPAGQLLATMSRCFSSTLRDLLANSRRSSQKRSIHGMAAPPNTLKLVACHTDSGSKFYRQYQRSPRLVDAGLFPSGKAAKEKDVEQAVADLTRALGRIKAEGVLAIWAKYDQLKIQRMLSFIPYESWLALLVTCQQAPPKRQRLLKTRSRERQSAVHLSMSMSKDDERGGPVDDSRIGRPRTHPLFPLQQNDRASLQSGFVKSFMGKEQSAVWTRHMAKRRALMFLSDMWRYSGTIQPVDSCGYLLSDTAAHLDHEDLIRRNKKYSAWRPSEHHYNIVFDVIGRDPSSKIEEIMALHGDMRARSVKEDTVTFNTILNACRQLGHWMYFIDIEQQMKERDEWGVTRMNARSWGTLIQGYKECKDWESVDKCISQATSACRVWYKAETDGKTPKKRGVEPTSQLWCTIISVYAARNMISQMLAARRIMSGFGLRMSAYVFGPIFSALHKARRLKLRDGKDIWPVIRIALSEYEAMVGAAWSLIQQC
ncbi:hypothetical protein BX070DRAFT_57751 [Coemansia spiralis]|nr:hypothetical protein BX070DRAFT_57751 [Coemansia spiralis]